MASKLFTLRPHHLYTLVADYGKGYCNLENALRTTMVSVNGTRRRGYTEQDAQFARNFYLEIASNPDNRVKIAGRADGVCIHCSNYNGRKCTLFSRQDLKFEDKRTFEYLARELGWGWRKRLSRRIRVSDIIRPGQEFHELPSQPDSIPDDYY